MADDGRVDIFVGRRGSRFSEPDEWRALIRDERLRREDVVAVRRGGETTYLPAGQLPELRHLFDEVEAAGPLATPIPPQPTPAPSPGAPAVAPTAPPPVQPVASAVPITPPGFASEPVTPSPPRAISAQPNRPPPPPRRRGGCGTVVWITLLALGLGLFLMVRSCGGDDAPSPLGDNAAAVASGQPVDRWVTRTSRVRSAPSPASAPPVGELARGDAVTGVLIPSATSSTELWMRLTRGRHAGRYVWASNLDTVPPPRLARRLSGVRTVARRGDSLARPALDAERLTTVSPGDRLRVAGSVGGGWLEILRPAGGVAYVQEDILRRETPPVMEDTATAPSEFDPE